MQTVFNTGDNDLIQSTIGEYRQAVNQKKAKLKKINDKDPETKTQAEVDAAEIDLGLSQKALTEAQLSYKMLVDDYNARVKAAAEAAQAALDAAKAVKLTQDEELALL
jgi:hypothetical protein